MRPIQKIAAKAAFAISLLGLFVGQASSATALPTATSIAAEMGLGWNLGNTMEATGGPTKWGNPLTTQKLIDSVKAAGFNTIRIPSDWDAYADQTTHVIDATWMAQVKSVVDMCIKDSLFVVLNIHWDDGWLEKHVDSAVNDPAMAAKIKAKQGAYWRQIATTFKDYDRHMLFASANEPAIKDTAPTRDAGMAMLLSFHQVFIDSVRTTGGNNASRALIVQGPNTDMIMTNSLMNTMPKDLIAGTGHLMAEVHYYSPYNFCGMTADATWGKMAYYWGQPYHLASDTARNAHWGEETYMDSVFALMQTKFVNQGIPVLIGEFGAQKRLTLTGASLINHLKSREYYYNRVAAYGKARGLIPVMWDMGGQGNNSMSAFDRTTGAITDLRLVNALRTGFGMTKLLGDTTLKIVDRSLKALYSAKDSLYGQVDLGVVKADISAYDSIIVKAYVNGQTDYDSAGVPQYGYVSLSLVTMSRGWTWREVSFGNPTLNSWATYSVGISTDSTNKAVLAPADPTKIDFFGLQSYSKGYNGTIYVDYIAFKNKNGTIDTLYSFDMAGGGQFKGNVTAISLIPTSDVTSDVEWKTATTAYVPKTTGILQQVNREQARTFVNNGNIVSNFSAPNAGETQVVLQNVQGKVIESRSMHTNAGMNSVAIHTNYHGVAILLIKQGRLLIASKMLGL